MARSERFKSSERAATSGSGIAPEAEGSDDAGGFEAGAGVAGLGWDVPSNELSAPAEVRCPAANDARHSRRAPQRQARDGADRIGRAGRGCTMTAAHYR